MTQTRITRESTTRATAERPKSWQPASILPEPDREPGYSYRWIRVSSLGKTDAPNLSKKMREGWEAVRIEEQPKFELFVDKDRRYKDNIEVQGLLLCKIPTEFMDQRRDYYSGKNKSQMDSVDNNFMRESDVRMPLFNEKRSSTSFGKGR